MEREVFNRLNQEAKERESRSLLGRLRASTLGQAAAVASSPFNSSNTTLIVDVSKYVPFADVGLMKAAGVRGIIARVGQGFNTDEDPTFAYYVAEGAKHNIPVMGYYVFDPSWPDNEKGCIDEQLARLTKWTKNKQLYGMWIDSEIYLHNDGRQIAASWISNRTRSMIDETTRAFPQWKVGLYTGGWFVDSYSPEMKNWIYKYPLWWAYYVYIKDSVQLEWNQLASYYPLTTPKNVPPDATGQGTAKLNLWQWSGDRLKLPGMYADAAMTKRIAADVNFYMGDEKAWYEWCGLTANEPPPNPDPDPDPEPEPEPVDPSPIVAALKRIEAQNAEIIELMKKPRVSRYE